MTDITHSQIDLSTGLNMHIAEAGQGPAVVFCHGFPELWYCGDISCRSLLRPDSAPSRRYARLRRHRLATQY